MFTSRFTRSRFTRKSNSTLCSAAFFLAFAVALTLPVFAQTSDDKDQNKSFDVRSSVGDLHLGSDADARKIGLPLYPGARLQQDKENHGQANLSLFTEAFGMKLVVASYVTDDPAANVLNFYRGKLKKYGKVLECHTDKQAGDISVHDGDKDSKNSKELKCDDGGQGPVNELKAGSEDDQHVVAIDTSDSGKGTTFALVYVHTRGKQGDI